MEKREEEKEQSERELEKRMFETDVVVTMERAFATKRQPMNNSCDALMRACGLRGFRFPPLESRIARYFHLRYLSMLDR